jgi:hypothetical protein
MTRSRNRSGRVLDAIVVALAVPTVAIAAMMGVREYDTAHEHALESYRTALARCDEASGAARVACRNDAVAARRNAAFDSRSPDEAAQQSADVADALARAQCDVLTGYSTDACGETQGARRPVAGAQPSAHLVATDDAREGLIAANPQPAR